MADAPTDADTRANEMLATGAVFAAMRGFGHPALHVDIVTGDDGDATNAVWVKFDFLKSRYRVTVTMDPDATGVGADENDL